MAEDNDGIADALYGQLRVTLTVAAQLGARFARIREEIARTRQAQIEQQNRELQARFAAERAAARAELTPVYERSWWDSASVEQIAGVHETATAWHGIDPEADRAGERIAEEVRARYGLDVQGLDADPAAVREALTWAERTRSEAAASRGESAADVAEAGAFLTAAETLDQMGEERQRQANEHDQRATDTDGALDVDRDVSGELRGDANANRAAEAEAFDSAERRERFASSLEGKADREVIDARMTTAADQARHPREAVTTAPKRATKARKTPTGQGQQRERHLGRRRSKVDSCAEELISRHVASRPTKASLDHVQAGLYRDATTQDQISTRSRESGRGGCGRRGPYLQRPDEDARQAAGVY